MANVYYIGDWAIMLGPVFAETPFNYAYKGLDTYNYAKWLKEAIESSGRHNVTSVPTWEFYALGPGAYEKILENYDAIIFSDVEAKNFQLAPAFFDRKQFGQEPLTFPDRVNLTVQAIQNGLGAMFLGGWLSFNGEMGKGGWGRTNLRHVLPVECYEYEDLRESTEGFTGEPLLSNHPLLKDISLESLPPILGYNRVKPREGCPVIAQWKGSQDPLLAIGTFGKGRTLAYTSDPAPHWGCNFVYWEHYHQLWSNAVDWLVEKRP